MNTILTKTCSHCGLAKPQSQFSRNRATSSGLDHRCKDCHATYKRINHKQHATNQRNHYTKVKLEAFHVYGGPRCVCCGESNIGFLTLDHVNNDGAQHRKGHPNSANKLYGWLKSNGYPPGFQVLCYNCNIGKYRHGGVCPHQI